MPRPFVDEQLRISKVTIAHVLHALKDDPRKFWLMGNGTESWAKLTEAAAALYGIPVEKIREDFKPNKAAYERYCAELEANEKLLQYCRDKGITGNE